MIDVFLLLGSNLGNRKLFLDKAIEHISTEIAPVEKASSIYETQSWGKTDEPDYLNQVIQIKTSKPARVILQKVLNIEQELGRVREAKWGSRVIDIDILFYGDEIIDEPDLKVPHSQLHNRRFTLEPLNELAPKLFHPVLRKNINQLKTELTDSLIVKKI
ncbi:2-amino-4-hydroxy-6-hydroxymethyldihydropteridine diphosphokinase [Mucilaginibacter achroorhodeus]|uniref:2-amino-4-hydroxy-6-hydroxymethyldihydropteridine pyrophosphokinase n=1 Tax=Mucilaginibacter achroorhodeus TaxID=2599294 RepID=A0A563U8F6_9SPHI|nr:2-amino-4-hydroxy-6-hydroxymethyldihydropteridine diphosphokinase [Mucilaginibacter achroorhodeus]TWR27662.1 2-amino-4-hydroxy-6-hydroxymethyldihydropteridine diphosphokinase [Mucilaginibacter achroorhodeus]